MSGFQKHGLKHVSASSMNKAREALDAWLAQYLFKHRFPSGWAALQGSSVEAGVTFGLYNQADPEDCVKLAQDKFKKGSLMFRNHPQQFEKRLALIEQMVWVSLEQLGPLGPPELPPRGKNQWKVEVPVRFREGKGGTVPAIGYLDFWYPDHDLILDLKTTAKAPTDWTLAHGIQASLYQRAKERELGHAPTVKFFYALSRKRDPYVWLELEDPTYFLAQFKRTVANLEKLLSGHTKEDLIAMIPHNPDSFYWNEAEQIKDLLYPV